MPSKKHKPPSQVKYDAAHPTLSVRLTPAVKAALDQVCEKEGVSYAGAMGVLAQREFAASVIRKAAFAEGYARGCKDGAWAGREQLRLERSVPCPRCGKLLDLDPSELGHRICIAKLGGPVCFHPIGQE